MIYYLDFYILIFKEKPSKNLDINNQFILDNMAIFKMTIAAIFVCNKYEFNPANGHVFVTICLYFPIRNVSIPQWVEFILLQCNFDWIYRLYAKPTTKSH